MQHGRTQSQRAGALGKRVEPEALAEGAGGLIRRVDDDGAHRDMPGGELEPTERLVSVTRHSPNRRTRCTMRLRGAAEMRVLPAAAERRRSS